MVQWLVEDCKVNINVIDRFKRTPLEVRAVKPQCSHTTAAALPGDAVAVCNWPYSRLIQPCLHTAVF